MATSNITSNNTSNNSTLADIMIDPDGLNEDLYKSIQNTCVHAGLSRKSWTGKMNDAEFKKFMCEEMGVEKGAITGGDINLFYDPNSSNKANVADELRSVQRVVSSAAQEHYKITIEARRGLAYLPSTQVEEYVRRMDSFKEQLRTAVEAWSETYDDTVDRSLYHLQNLKGKTVTRQCYPSADQLPKLFMLEYIIEPLPNDSVPHLPASVMESLSQELHARVESQLRSRLSLAWEGLTDRLKRMKTQMEKQENRKIYESAFGGIKQEVERLRAFNLAGDNNISKLLDDIEELAEVDVTDVREDEFARKDVARTATDALSRIDELAKAGATVQSSESEINDEANKDESDDFDFELDLDARMAS